MARDPYLSLLLISEYVWKIYNQKTKEYGKNRVKYIWRRQRKKKGTHEGTQKNYYHKCLKIKQKVMTWKKVEAVVITNFIEGKVKSFSDAEVYINDDYDSEQDKVIGFR